MTSKILKCVAWALVLAGMTASCSTPGGGRNSASSATEALQKARVAERLAEGMAVEKKGSSPGFVLDPAWPQAAAEQLDHRRRRRDLRRQARPHLGLPPPALARLHG